jgi:hypothetical protein
MDRKTERVLPKLSVEALAGPLGARERADIIEDLPTGCWHCLRRITGRTSALCPSHGDEWEAER